MRVRTSGASLVERFDAVLALSHLVNSDSRASGVEVLRTCRRHVRDDGVVIVERYPPEWTPTERARMTGGLEVRWHDAVFRDDGFSARVTCLLDGRSWTQAFDAVPVDDAELERMANEAGLTVSSVLDAERAWVVLRP